MARYNEVQIGATYLTNTGLNGGKPCKVQVTGLNQLITTKTGQVLNSADGTPYAQLIDFDHKGLTIEVLIDWISKTVFDAIVSAHESAKNAGTSFALNIDGDTGTYALTVIPAVPEDIVFEGFSNGIIKNAGFRYITT